MFDTVTPLAVENGAGVSTVRPSKLSTGSAVPAAAFRKAVSSV
jgi:hypothetical protein